MVDQRVGERDRDGTGGHDGDRPGLGLGAVSAAEGALETISLGDFAGQAIAQYFHQALKYEGAVLADQDPENLHQMRVNLRRLRSATRALATGVKLPKAASDRRLAKLARILGQLRDLDVMGDRLRQERRHFPAGSPEAVGLKQALRACAIARPTAFAQVQATLRGREYHRCTTALQDWLDRPRWRPAAAWPAATVVPDLLLPELAQLLAHAAWLLSAPEAADLSPAQWVILHDLRKQAKRLRYCLALFQPFYQQAPSEQQGAVDSLLRELSLGQTCLGELQDNAVLAEFLHSAIGKDWVRRLPALAARLAGDRAEAWAAWLAWREQWSAGDRRHQLRQALG